jgi:Tfp pilus assembly protein PilF
MRPISFVIIVALLAGCVVQQPQVSLEARNKALGLVDQGVRYLRVGALDEAQASFESAAEIAHLPAALDGLGSVAFLKGSPDVAIKLLEAAYDNGSYPMALANLAIVHESLGNLNLAHQLYMRAIKEDPTNFRARGNYSVFLADYLNETERARSELLKAKAIEAAPLLVHNQKVLEKERY